MDLPGLARLSDDGVVRQQVQELLDGSPAAADGQALQDLGDQDEEDDDQGGEELADNQGRRKGDLPVEVAESDGSDLSQNEIDSLFAGARG